MTSPADILRSSRAGVLAAGERVFPVRFVIARDGRLVAPLEREAIEVHTGHTLFLPEESEDALQLLVHLAELGTDPAVADRWRAYHGTPRSTRWCAMSIESGRLGSLVADGSELTLLNPLAPDEPALCRLANADRSALRRAVLRGAGVDVPHPVCVGVDDHGLDVRARFGIVRVQFDDTATSESAARSALARLLVV